MSSNDLLNALPAEVYTALDASAHLEITARAKLHKSIETSGLGNQLDLTIAAPFGYQTSLQHSRNAPWNPLARGLALALAGRYAHVDPNGSVDSDDQEDVEALRLPVLERLRTQWQDMLPTWSSDHEISLTEVGHLWHGVTWVQPPAPGPPPFLPTPMSLYPSFLTPEIAYLPSIHLNSPPQTIFLNSTAVIAGRRRSTCRNPAAASRASYHRCRRPYTRPWISPWTEQSQAATRFRTPGPLQTPPPTSAAASAGKSAVPKLLLSLSLQVKRASIRSSRQRTAPPTSADRKYSIFTVDIATSPAINR
jgi:hypothetical protein